MSLDAQDFRPDAPLPAEQFEALRRFDTCTLANAIEATGVRPRNEGYADSTIRCLFPALGPLLGYALTLRASTTRPPVHGLRYADHIDWADQLLTVPQPRVLVVEDMQKQPASGSLMGEVHANIYRALGCVGLITNGAVRDLPAVQRLGFHAFASCVAVSHAYAHVVEVGTPITIGGLTVHTGDLLHGDRHGVLSIPSSVAANLPVIAAEQKREEQQIIAFCKSTDFSVAGLEQMFQSFQREHPLP